MMIYELDDIELAVLLGVVVKGHAEGEALLLGDIDAEADDETEADAL